ncbi:MAG: OmpA family protein [Flavobacteriales bacterium]
MKHRSVLLALCTLITGVCCAQGYSLRMGDKAFAGLAYHDAIGHYEEAMKHGADTGAFMTRLAESYFNVRDFHNAAKWYARTTSASNARPVDLYNYSQCLRATGQFEEADHWMAKYHEIAAGDGRATAQLGSVAYANALLAKPLPGCIVENVKENCTHSDMGSAYWGDRLVFASARKPDAAARRRHAWNGDPFLDLYTGKIGADGQLTDIQPLKDLNTKFHDSNAAFSASGQEVWFTRNNYSDGKKGRTADGVVNLKIYSRILSEGHWMVERSFPFNSEAYSTGHPALSADGKTIYFTSDMPGGRGGTDIWMCERKSESEWLKPVNLGPMVNTEGDEMFPFVQSDGTLYFSTDGHPGLGGLDIFVSKAGQEGFTRAINAGVPINSHSDDFAILLDATGLKGYLTSDRSGGMGGDDLYSFTLRKPLGATMKVRGMVRDKVSHEPAVNAKILLKDAVGSPLRDVTTGPDGEYTFGLEEGHHYELATDEGAYRRTSQGLVTGPLVDTTFVRDIELAKLSDVYLWMMVSDAKTRAPLSGVDVRITNTRDAGSTTMEGVTEEGGELFTNLKPMSIGDSLVYQVVISKQGYFPKTSLWKHRLDRTGKVVLNEYIDCSLSAIDVGMDIAKVIDIKPIYFDLGKHKIRQDAAAELDKIVQVMSENPTMVIELGSHTDSRGSDKSNLALSDKRAKSSAAYIVSKGIAQDRITGKGYGETKLLNNCGNGAKCSDTEHQMNRRTEFIVVRM